MAKPLQARLNAQSLFSKNMLLRAIGFLIWLVLLICLFTSNLAAQTIIKSENDGSWNSPNTWHGGTIPTATDNVTINNHDTIKLGTTAEVYDLTIGSTGKLVVEGTLIVNGNLEMDDSGNDPSEFILAPNSVTVVRKNVSLSTKVDLNISSYFIVMGDLDAQSAGTNTNININEASIYIFGSISNKTDLKTCDEYDGLTEDNTENCHVGTDSAFYNNIDSIPTEIIEIVNGCNPPTATISGNATVCAGDTQASIFYSATSGTPDKFSIDFDTDAESHGFADVSEASLSGGQIEIQVPESAQPDTYNATLTVSDSVTGCTSEYYNISIMIHPLPATGEITPD